MLSVVFKGNTQTHSIIKHTHTQYCWFDQCNIERHLKCAMKCVKTTHTNSIDDYIEVKTSSWQKIPTLVIWSKPVASCVIRINCCFSICTKTNRQMVYLMQIWKKKNILSNKAVPFSITQTQLIWSNWYFFCYNNILIVLFFLCRYKFSFWRRKQKSTWVEWEWKTKHVVKLFSIRLN